MNKKRVIGVLIIFFFLAVPAYAKTKDQTQKPITADDIAVKMKAQLGLSDEQVEEVKPIIQNYLDQLKQLKLEEKKQLSRVLTGQQLYTWNFLQNEPPSEKKKHSKL